MNYESVFSEKAMRKRTGEKQKRIAEAAIRVFARDGYHAAMISRIADEAGVATGSVYLYFDGKESILHHLFSQLWQGLHEMFEQVVNDRNLDEAEKIEALIEGVFSTFARDPSLAQVFVAEQQHLVRDGTGDFMRFYEEFLTLGEQVFQRGIESGLFRSDLSPHVFTHVVFGAIRQLLNQWVRTPRAFPLSTLRVELQGMLMRGVRP